LADAVMSSAKAGFGLSRKRSGWSLIIDFVISKGWWWKRSRRGYGESRVGMVRYDSVCRAAVEMGTREREGGTVLVAQGARPLVRATVVHAPGATSLATPVVSSLATGLGAVVVVGVVTVVVRADVAVVRGVVVAVVVGAVVVPTRLPASRGVSTPVAWGVVAQVRCELGHLRVGEGSRTS
jgi:hypothetical protein